MSYGRVMGGHNPMATKRIKKEMADLSKENTGAITLQPDESNIFHWKARIPGPAGSPYEGGMFDVAIDVPSDYPFSPPHLLFMTKVYHCNINAGGGICLDLLKHAWSPALSLYKVILSLSSLLTDPNPSDPLVPQIATQYRSNRKAHDEEARAWTKLYAIKGPSAPAPVAAAAAASANRGSRIRNFLTTWSGSDASPTPTAMEPPPPVAGVRRAHPSSRSTARATGHHRMSSSDTSDIEVLGDAGASTAANGTGGAKTKRPPKRARTEAAGESSGSRAETAIVIDDD